MTAAIAPLLIAAFSFLLRIKDLSRQQGFVFDEVYYVDGARDLIKYGVEVTGSKPEFIVHPPMGKWMIALGIRLFGDSEFGWRIMSAIIGTLLILLIALVAYKLFYSPLLTAGAALLMALDGLALVHSRTALLDLFLTFFILLATFFWIVNKPWVTGIFLGLALATKWSALYFIALFFLISLYRIFTFHQNKEMPASIARKVASHILLPLSIYIATWWGWFASDRGWDRDSSPNVFIAFWRYQRDIFNFHTHLTQSHNYQSNPWGWSLMLRPTSFYYQAPSTCGAAKCSQEILALGTPLLWWAGTIAILVVFGIWLSHVFTFKRDRALNVIVAGIVAGYLPWFLFQKRTVFSFYAIVFEPFMILALLYCARRILAIPGKTSQIALALFLLLVAVNFFYFLPLFNGTPIPYDAWIARMWLPSWI